MGSKREKGYSRRIKRKTMDFSFYAGMGLKLIFSVLIIGGLSLTYLLGYSVITQCNYLKAEKIYVSGEKQLSKEDVLKQAQVYSGMNILSANIGVIRKRLLAHPDIISAEVGRVFPRSLYIAVKEHQPLAVVDFGNKYVMNTQGEIYKNATNTDTMNLPVVTGLTFYDFERHIIKKNNPHQAVMRILQLNDKDQGLIEKISGPVKHIHVDRQMGITLFSEDKTHFTKLGYGDYSQKINTLNAVIQYMETKYQLTEFRAVDVVKEDNVVLSPILLKEYDLENEEV